MLELSLHTPYDARPRARVVEVNSTLWVPCHFSPFEASKVCPGQSRIQGSLMMGVLNETDWTLVVGALAVTNCCTWDLETVTRAAAAVAASAGTVEGVVESR